MELCLHKLRNVGQRVVGAKHVDPHYSSSLYRTRWSFHRLPSWTMNHSVNSSASGGPDVLYAASITALLLVPPVNIYVLVLMVRGGLETITSEFYCLNLAVSDILMCFFCLFYVIEKDRQGDLFVFSFFLGFLNISPPLFQCCICVERYLAVVHPVIFLRYKLLRYKIMCCSVVWFITLGFCVAFIYFVQITKVLYKVMDGCYTVVFPLMLFCCVSVLRALKRPGPGDGRRRRAGGNDAKTRAFNIIVITTVISVVNYLPYGLLLPYYETLNRYLFYTLLQIVLSISILNGLLNPFLYLKRAAKLPSFHIDFQRFMRTK